MLSLPKLLLLIVIAGVAWYGWRIFQRKIDQRDAADRVETGKTPAAEDMVRCRVCGTYVAAAHAKSCGRSDCPYPKAG